jgi:hypothetical protein
VKWDTLKGVVVMSRQSDFIALVTPGAQEVQRQVGMFASVTIAQAAWETGWGVSTPKDINTGEESYNLFGRKAAAGEPYVESRTWEVYGGQKVYITAKFKKFDNYIDSILDRSEFLKKKWYQRACNTDNPWDAARFLIDTGYPGYAYATDPSYVANLHSIMQSYNLTQYDLPKEDEEDMAVKDDVAALQKQVADLNANVSELFRVLNNGRVVLATPPEEQKVAEWAAEGQNYVKKNGISDGERPESLVSRQEIWTMLKRLTDKIGFR